MNQFMYFLINNNQIFIIIFAAHAPWYYMMTMYFFDLKHSIRYSTYKEILLSLYSTDFPLTGFLIMECTMFMSIFSRELCIPITKLLYSLSALYSAFRLRLNSNRLFFFVYYQLLFLKLLSVSILAKISPRGSEMIIKKAFVSHIPPFAMSYAPR